jgi:YHS domain-containing protein
MKYRFPSPSFRPALAAGLLLTVLTLSARDEKNHDQPPAQAPVGVLVPVDAKTDATWLAKARAAYPLDYCPLCDDHITREASPKVPEYIYRAGGKPDRLVRFCNDDECIAKFKKDPDKYLKIIADAADAKAAPAQR